MSQPIWITPSGSLGTIPEGVFYKVPVQAVADGEDVFFKVIAGELPTGIQITSDGVIEGVPRNILNFQGVPLEVPQDVTSKFAIRAYTVKVVDGQTVVDRINDRTFTITVTGQDIPEFVTPPGRIATFFDGTKAKVQIEFTDGDLEDNVYVRLASGQLPPGLALNPYTGLISGIIFPLSGPPGSATPGYDRSEYSKYPYDFAAQSSSTNFQFTLEITDGKNSNLRTFEIYVYAVSELSASDTGITADNTFIRADGSTIRVPVLINEPGNLGTYRSDNFYAYKFNGIDFDGAPFVYELVVGNGLSIPPGLSLNSTTGWLSGYLPDQGAVENSYRFGIRLRKVDIPSAVSDVEYFTIGLIGPVAGSVYWITPNNIGTVLNGSISNLSVEAVDTGGRALQYRLVSGSQLPQGLKLMPSGNIVGRVSFNTFSLDGGTTTFDQNIQTRAINNETTFDLTFKFTVNAFAPATEEPTFKVSSIAVVNGGSGYSNNPTVLFSAPPDVEGAVQAVAGAVTVQGGVITSIEVAEPGKGYITVPTITIIDSTGTSAKAEARIEIAEVKNVVSIFRTFTVMIDREFNTPYQSLYIKAMPPYKDRELINQLVLNQDIIPVKSVYRNDDPNFGVSKSVVYTHAYGLEPDKIENYVAAVNLNHYWKNLTLGEVAYAEARDSAGNIIYEVVYSRVVDNLVNNQGVSVNKSVTIPYPAITSTGQTVNIVYPNSLENMRNQVIDTVGQISPLLPAWMTSKQSDGRVLGFTPAWVIAYVKPGQGARVVYNIKQQFGDQLNRIDYKADRYEIDRRATFAWDETNKHWLPYPPEATTFDNNTTIFDGNGTQFISPSFTVTSTDDFDKYVLYPKTNILG